MPYAGPFNLARYLTRWRLKTLYYHSFAIDDESEFRPRLFIKGGAFLRRMKALARQGMTVLSVDDAVAPLYAGKLPDDSA